MKSDEAGAGHEQTFGNDSMQSQRYDWPINYDADTNEVEGDPNVQENDNDEDLPLENYNLSVKKSSGDRDDEGIDASTVGIQKAIGSRKIDVNTEKEIIATTLYLVVHMWFGR